ncbi:MAG: class I SAM-dependent methyltransferase [Firmicutes bacterium]|nr:class I SAM-dependent methyltransferase [Bacillota bacterium]
MAEALLFQLNPRLKAAAEFVRRGKKFVDIGTDHAYLPIWLLKSGTCPQAIATDLREGPILRATHNAFRYRVQNRLVLRQCDGLAAVAPEEADDIAIAGMGGELIARIIEQAPWVREEQKRLILQPMTAAEELRRYLRRNGFSILQERAVRDGDHVYTVMQVQYTGEQEEPSALFCYTGRLDPKNSADAADYIRQQQRHLSNIQQGFRIRGEQEQEEQIGLILRRMDEMFQESSGIPSE